MLLSSAGSYTLGCEITDRSIKTIQLKRSGTMPKIISIGHTRLKSGIVKDGKIEDFNALEKALRSAISKIQGKKLYTNDAVLSIPDSQTFVKTVTIDTAQDGDIRDKVLKEIQKHFPLDPEEAIFDWQELKRTAHHTQVIVSAVNKDIAEPYFELCKKVGWHVLALELEAEATARALLGKNLDTNAMIIDIGYAHSSLILVADKTIQFTLSLPISNKMIIEMISQKLKLSAEQAEKAKIKCGLDEKKCKGALKIVLDAILDDLAFKIEDAFQYFEANTDDYTSSINTVILTGGGAHLAGIERVLTNKLKHTVEKSNVKKFVRPINPKTFPHMANENLYSFVTPIGLALRNIHSRFL